MRNDRTGGRRLRLLMWAGRGCRRGPGPLAPCWPEAAVLAATLFALPATARAQAQTTFGATVVSEYSVRGASLSRGRPEPQLRVDWDGSGWYAGALASGAALRDSSASVQLVGYGGYAHQLPSGLSWEAGTLQNQFGAGSRYHYHEFYAGLARDGIGGRVYYSPAYYGEGKTVYAELNGAWPLAGRFTLAGHVGLLQPLGHGGDEARRRLDLRATLGVDLGALRLQLAVLASAPDGGRDAPHRLMLGASYAF